MADDFQDFTIAAVQAAPIPLDRDASIDKACHWIEKTAAAGASLAVFGETWVPGYPQFGRWPAKAGFGGLLKSHIINGVEVPSPATDALCGAARRAGIDVAIGIAERDSLTQGSIYCCLLFIGREGVILGKHRKLKPTFWERTVWGEGDGSTLRLYERPYARLGGLNCWEHQMVLPGYALIAQGIQVHAAVWPGWTETRQETLSQAFAMQAGAYVVMAGGLMRPEDIPAELQEWYNPMNGDSAIYGPDGQLLAGPLLNEEGILTATANIGHIMATKMWSDHAGHYTRPDVFDFRVNATPRRIATFSGRDEAMAAAVKPALAGGIESGAIRNGAELNGAFEDLLPETKKGRRRARA
ncbi:MAG: carbon-nitrogen hydrolase family protein [Tepidiformaceae bacterium]